MINFEDIYEKLANGAKTDHSDYVTIRSKIQVQDSEIQIQDFWVSFYNGTLARYGKNRITVSVNNKNLDIVLRRVLNSLDAFQCLALGLHYHNNN